MENYKPFCAQMCSDIVTMRMISSSYHDLERDTHLITRNKEEFSEKMVQRSQNCDTNLEPSPIVFIKVALSKINKDLSSTSLSEFNKPVNGTSGTLHHLFVFQGIALEEALI